MDKQQEPVIRYVPTAGGGFLGLIMPSPIDPDEWHRRMAELSTDDQIEAARRYMLKKYGNGLR